MKRDAENCVATDANNSFAANVMNGILKNSRFFPEVPTEHERAQAQASSRRLAPFLGTPVHLQVQGEAKRGSEKLDLPPAAFRLLLDILAEMAQGNAVTLVPVHAELTTQQAADMLNVSRPFLIKELEAGKVKFRRVGRHRRILYADLVAHKTKTDTARNSALDELAAQAQELGMGYK